MVFKKYLLVLSSLACINLTYAACTNSQTCLDDGVNYSNSNTAGAASNINNSVIESAVGADRITDANSTRDSIQNTMGGNYKNIDGMNNAGNTKAAACQGKTTQECSAYNYYNDPLTKQGQDSIKDAVSMASDLINKKITENIEIKGYCASNPNDSICKMCAKDPSQAMCQAGNKCTTISYKSTGVETKHACEIIGQRGYACNSWVDNVISHWSPPTPVDGTQIVNMSHDGNNSGEGFGEINHLQLILTSYQSYTDQQQVLLTANYSYKWAGACDFGAQTASIVPNFTSGAITLDTKRKDNACFGGNNPGSAGYSLSLQSMNCSGSSCNVVFQMDVWYGYSGGFHYGSNIITGTFTKPIGSQLVIDNVVWKDNCAQ